MSIPVAVSELPATLTGFGVGYLLTAGDPAERPGVKAVSVAPDLRDGVLVVRAPGRGSLANATHQPAVTVLYPPREEGGYSLLVDGQAQVAGDDVLVTPTSAVLHRPVDQGAVDQGPAHP
ncbi:pyridoxamine 5'-phosphate oxidase [Nocardioides pacificus]